MQGDTWLEASLIVNGELAEAVTEVLARYAPNGVVIESTGVTAGPDDSEGRAIGPLRVSAYLPMDGQIEATRHKLEEALWYLGRIQPLPPVQFRPIQETNWAESWKQHYRPIALGQKLVIVPAWLESPQPERIAIRIDPGMAFGTGTHPTTQLCLELIENFYQQNTVPDDNVIDIGCGSGILSIAALKLGARQALGVDIDLDAVNAARENAELNHVSEQFSIGLGSVNEVRIGEYSIQRSGLVLANILAPVLVQLLDNRLGDLVLPGGWLILSGILKDQAPKVEEALQRHGLNLHSRQFIDDWVALAAKR